MIKKTIAFTFSFIMMGFVILGIGYLFLTQQVANLNTYHKTLKQIEVEQSIQREIENLLIDMMLLNNMPTSLVRDLVPTDLVKSQVEQNIELIHQALTGEEVKLADQNFESVISEFEQRIQEFLVTENKFLKPSDQESLEIIKNEISKIIKNETMILNPQLLSESKTVYQLTFYLQKIFNFPILPIIVGCIIGTWAILQLLFLKDWAQGLRFASIGIIAGGLFWLIIGLSANLSGFYEQAMIQSGYLKDIVVHLGKTFFHYLTTIGVITVLLGMFGLIPYFRITYQKFLKQES